MHNIMKIYVWVEPYAIFYKVRPTLLVWAFAEKSTCASSKGSCRTARLRKDFSAEGFGLGFRVTF